MHNEFQLCLCWPSLESTPEQQHFLSWRSNSWWQGHLSCELPCSGDDKESIAPVSSINTKAGLIYCISCQYSTHRFIFGLFLKLRKSIFRKKDLWCADEALKHILVQRHNKFCGIIIFSQQHKHSMYILGKIF